MFRPTRVVFTLLVLIATTPPAAMATPPCVSDPSPTIWRPDGTVVTSTSAVPLELIVVPDPRGAAEVFWNDFRNPNKVSLYSRYVTSEGWQQTTECRVSSSPGNEAQSSFARAPEQSLLTVWSDDRDDDGDIYVQRSSFGCGRWPSYIPDGIPVCTAPGRQAFPSVAVDGKEGFYVSWVDQRFGSTTGTDIYIQRFHDYGQVWEGWPVDGVRLCASPGEEFEPVVVADGSGGALVFFLDATKPADLDLFMGRISETGVVPDGWTNGKAVTTSPADQGGPIVLPVAAGGAFVAWLEVTLRGANPEMGIRLTRVTGQGEAAPGWSLDGLSVGTVAGTAGAPTLAGDGADGVFVGWVEQGGFSGEVEALVSRADADGVTSPGWPMGGRRLGAATWVSSSVALLGEQGTVLAAWTDPGDVANIRAKRLDGDGNVAPFWPAEGVLLSEAAGQQRLDTVRPGEPAGGTIVSDGSGGAIVFWIDFRTNQSAIYAQRISKNGVVSPREWWGPPCDKRGWITRAYPVPTRGAMTIEAFASNERSARFEVYDMRGRLRHVERVAASPGPAILSFPIDLSALRPGVYFVRYIGEGPYPSVRGTRRVVVAR